MILNASLKNVHESIADGQIAGLAFDWITGTIYVGTVDGYILACDPTRTANLTCATVLSNQGWVYGISLNPVEG